MSILTAPRELFFTRTLDPDRARKRYRALALVLHPDLDTGDTALMQRLNAEFDAYERGELRPAEPEPTPYTMPRPRPDQSWYQYTQETHRHLVEQAGQRIIDQVPSWVRAEVLFTVCTQPPRVIATGGKTYENKEALKLYGFRWDADNRQWWHEVQL